MIEVTIDKKVLYATVKTNLLKPSDINKIIQAVQDSDHEEANHTVLNLLGVDAVSQVALPFFCKAASIFCQDQKKFSMVVKRETEELLRENKMSNLFRLFFSLEEFEAQNRPTSRRETVRLFLNTLVESAVHSLGVSLEEEITCGAPQIIRPEARLPHVEVGATAGIISDQFMGNLTLCFTEDIFLKIMSLFLQFEVTEISSDIRDGGAELLNVIIGQTKMKLSDQGFNIKQVVPTVVTGAKIDFSPSAGQVSLLIPLKGKFGEFFISLQTNDAGMSTLDANSGSKAA